MNEWVPIHLKRDWRSLLLSECRSKTNNEGSLTLQSFETLSMSLGFHLVDNTSFVGGKFAFIWITISCCSLCSLLGLTLKFLTIILFQLWRKLFRPIYDEVIVVFLSCLTSMSRYPNFVITKPIVWFNLICVVLRLHLYMSVIVYYWIWNST